MKQTIFFFNAIWQTKIYLFFADDPFFGHQERGKNSIRSRRQKHPKKHQQQQQLQKDLLNKLNDTFIEKLDASCYGKLRIGKPVKPPIVKNANFVKYGRYVVLLTCYEIILNKRARSLIVVHLLRYEWIYN